MYHVYENKDNMYYWILSITRDNTVIAVSKSILFDTKVKCFNCIRTVAESLNAEDSYVADHTNNLIKSFRYKQTPAGVLKSGPLVLLKEYHSREIAEIKAMKNHHKHDLFSG